MAFPFITKNHFYNILVSAFTTFRLYLSPFILRAIATDIRALRAEVALFGNGGCASMSAHVRTAR